METGVHEYLKLDIYVKNEKKISVTYSRHFSVFSLDLQWSYIVGIFIPQTYGGISIYLFIPLSDINRKKLNELEISEN